MGFSAAMAAVSVNIDLAQQKAFLLQDGQIVYESPISSGRAGHRTPTGVFQILQKDENHFSTMYGRIVDDAGRIVVRDADSDMVVPAGCTFVPAPMKHFMRFDGATGMHAGILPGYPASHGCVRMPRDKAALFFDILQVGDAVRVFGDPPERTSRIRPMARPTPPPPIPSPSPTPVAPMPWRGFFWGHAPAAATPPPWYYPR